MSDTLEHLIDITLNMRERRRRQHEAELDIKESAIRGSHVELERRRTRFSTEVRSLIQDAVEQANHHLMTRPEKYKFHEMLGYSIGPWYPGSSICNPIVYQLQVDSRKVGEALFIDLSHDGMVEALLGQLCASDHQARPSRISFGWHPIPLFSFDSRKAADLLVQYLAAVTERSPRRNERPDSMAS